MVCLQTNSHKQLFYCESKPLPDDVGLDVGVALGTGDPLLSEPAIGAVVVSVLPDGEPDVAADDTPDSYKSGLKLITSIKLK